MTCNVGQDILRGGAKASAQGVGRTRIRVMHSVFILVFGLFILKTFWLGVQGTDRARIDSDAGQWAIARADIVDRNGDILAKNVVSGHIVLRPPQIRDADAAAQMIHDVMPTQYTVAGALDLINSGRKFIYLKKLATDGQREKIIKSKIAGLDVESIQTRKYPKRNLFSHAVGFAGNDGVGLEGADRIYDQYLRENRDPLRLSLDSRIQSVFYEQLSIAMQKYNARAAMGMLINSRTGEMIAMVSMPDFDPENIGATPQQNRMFMPLRGVFEMGSIFKIFNTALAFENNIDKKYFVDAPYKVLDKFGRTATTIHDISSFKKTSKKQPYMSAADIMLNSCNVGSTQIALDLPDGAQREFFERAHLADALDLEFGRTERPMMPRQWGPVEKATVSFGHGIAVTPMHLLLAVNAMSNGGIYIWPTLQKRDIGAIKGERIITPEISGALRDIMFRVAEETSAKAARIQGINIGGKTATAEKRVNGKIDRNKNLTAFVGAFPIEAPQYTVLIVLDEPKATAESFGWRTAAWNAVPVTGKILDSILPLLFE
ncbi:MAG: penicillin-binding protein 2 [Rickettsiales bacterium]|jgi:cell division protein FtsI (penicillin-binding protein 3)|nr:penicillin-binding protein 2 [Rickettsiales bacterium]